MLFLVTWVPRNPFTEERDKRTLKLFTNWKAPAGLEFKGFYDYADGNGGAALIETGSAETMLEGFAPWTTFFEFTVKPLVSVEKSTPIFEKGIAWRDSVR